MKAKAILQFSIGPIGAGVLSLITLPFVAWFFTVEDVGRLTMLQVVLGLVVSLFSLAMHQAYVREYHESENRPALFKLSVLPGLVALILFTFCLLILPFSVSNLLFGINSPLLTILLFTAVYSSFLINFLAHVIRMEERGIAFSASQIAPKAFLLIFISLIIILNLTAEFETLMIMNTFSIVFSLFIFSFLTKDTWIVAFSQKVEPSVLKSMLKFSLPLVASGMAYWGLTTIDRFFLRSLSGFEELGVYALASALAGAVSVITSIFSSLWHPTLYKWVKEGVEPCKVQNVIETVFLASVFIWSTVGIFSFTLSVLLPDEYQLVEYLIVGCIAMPLFYLISETTGIGIGITRRTIFTMIASVVALLVNGILNYFLIPEYGASGATIASIFAFFIFFIIKTEASVKLWLSFPRFKLYLILSLYSICTCTSIILRDEARYIVVLWVLLFLSSCFLFKKRFLSIVFFLKKSLRQRF